MENLVVEVIRRCHSHTPTLSHIQVTGVIVIMGLIGSMGIMGLMLDNLAKGS